MPDTESPPKQPPVGNSPPVGVRTPTQPFADALNGQNLVITIIGLAGVIILSLISLKLEMDWPYRSSTSGSSIVLLMIAAGALASGSVVGLVLTAGGDEKEIFGSMSTVINGVIGGFTIADLSRTTNGAIVGALRSLASAAGLPGIGLVSTVVVFFGAVGFVLMFVNRQYVLKPAIARRADIEEKQKQLQAFVAEIQSVQVSVDPFERSMQTAADESMLSVDDREKRVELLEQEKKRLLMVLENFNGALSNTELFQSLPLETIRAYAKACVRADKLDTAELILRQARSIGPDNTDLIFQLAIVLTARGRYEEALAHLSYLVHLPSVRVGNYKLIGYVGLFIPGRLDEAEDASRKYLAIYPDDAGAKLNLACALGQRGPASPKRGDAIRLLREVIHNQPAARPFVMNLSKGGGDFSAWTGDREFDETVKPFTQA